MMSLKITFIAKLNIQQVIFSTYLVFRFYFTDYTRKFVKINVFYLILVQHQYYFKNIANVLYYIFCFKHAYDLITEFYTMPMLLEP